MTRSHVYIAGPMRRHPGFNFQEFYDAEAYLKRHCDVGTIFNPARRDADLGFAWEGKSGFEDLDELGFDLADAMRADLDYIVNTADWVLMLPGWKDSTGAKHEKATAEMCGKNIWYYDPDDREGSRLSSAPLSADVHTSWEDVKARGASARSDAMGGPIVAGPNTVVAAPYQGEVRITNELTGGAKGQKLEQMSMLPPRALFDIARVFEYGSRKYERDNWRRGYDWNLSYDALQRHLMLFWDGNDLDLESGLSHLAHAGFHVLALLTFLQEHPDGDNRFRLC